MRGDLRLTTNPNVAQHIPCASEITACCPVWWAKLAQPNTPGIRMLRASRKLMAAAVIHTFQSQGCIFNTTVRHSMRQG